MNKSKLTKEKLEGFSISYNKAKSLGITDDDLKYIYEIGENKFRISIRFNGKRYTKVVYDLLDAINTKSSMIRKLETEKPKIINQTLYENYRDLKLNDGFDLFFKYRMELVNKGLIEKTTYEKDLLIYQGRHIRECELLNKKIMEINSEDAQTYVNKLFSTTQVNSDKKLSENTISNPYELMHRVFEYFKNKLKIIKNNPFDEVDKKPKYKARERNYLANVDIHYVLSQIDKKNIRFRTFVNLFLETGLRVEEITAIKYSDINRLRSTIKINRALVKSRLTGELIIKDLKTYASEREITISKHTLDLIDNYKLFKEQCGTVITDDDYIFTSWKDNDLISPSRYTAEWKNFIRSLGYDEKLPLTIIRHSSATFMLQGETNIEAVKRRFGWSKVSTVLGIYNQSNLEEDKKLLDKFEQEFRNALGLTYAELYKICANRFNNKRKTNALIQKLLSKSLDKINFEQDLNLCRNYLLDLFPIFSKIMIIDNQLDDEEIEAIFAGFKPIYKDIKIEPINNE